MHRALMGHMSPGQKRGGKGKKKILKKFRDLIWMTIKGSVKKNFDFFYFFKEPDSKG